MRLPLEPGPAMGIALDLLQSVPRLQDAGRECLNCGAWFGRWEIEADGFECPCESEEGWDWRDEERALREYERAHGPEGGR